MLGAKRLHRTYFRETECSDTVDPLLSGDGNGNGASDLQLKWQAVFGIFFIFGVAAFLSSVTTTVYYTGVLKKTPWRGVCLGVK